VRHRRRWIEIQRIRRLRHDPLYPLVLVGLMGIVAYLVFVFRFFWG
jgi:hypothetical protein